MKITHYSNSFVGVKENTTSILCDPWVGFGSENGWLSFPIFKNSSKLFKEIQPTHIYISHLHCDHFDKTTLKNIKNKKIKIVIKNFKNKRFINKIRELGFSNIIECEEWKRYKINKDFSIAIIPQITSNSSGAEDAINYDLDTSIVIQSNISKKIFYNNVDNPLNVKDLVKVRKFIKKEFRSKIDVCCMPAGAAGEYPHCFTNINRVEEKNKVINSHLKELGQQLKTLDIKNFFPAGGIYTIYGKFYHLNKLIAEPKDYQVENLCKKLRINYFNILGAQSLNLENGRWVKKLQNEISLPTKKTAIENSRHVRYFYEKTNPKYDEKKLDKFFLNSKKNYFNIIKNFKIKTSWKVDFYIYKNLILNADSKLNKKKSKFFKKYSLNFNKEKGKFSHLKCFLDYTLFEGMLTKKFTWNPALSGSVIMFERTPNVFDPNLTYSLNFLNHNK